MVERIGSKIVEPILDGLFSLVEKWVVGFLQAILNYFSDGFGPDMQTFQNYIGASNLQSIHNILFYTAIGIASVIFLWNMFTFAFQRIREDNDSYLVLFERYIISLFLIGAGKAFVETWILGTAQSVYTWVTELVPENNNANMVSTLLDSVVRDITVNIEVPGFIIFQAILSIIFAITIIVNFFKFAIEIVERYVTMAFLVICFPIASATYASKSTKRIYGAYWRMLISEIAMLVLNEIFIFGFLSMAASGAVAVSGVIGLAFIIAYLRLAQRADAVLRSLGMNTAQTGGNLLDEARGALGVMTMAGHAATIGISGATSALGHSKQVAGVANGDFGKFAAGQKMTNAAHKKADPSDTQILKDFAAKGGKLNPADNTAKEAAARSAMTTGYSSLSSMPQDMQEAVVQKTLGEGVNNAAVNAGFGNATLKDVSVGAGGNISARMMYGDGREMGVNLSKTPPKDPTSQIGTVTDSAGNRMYLSRSETPADVLNNARAAGTLKASNPDVMDAAAQMTASKGMESLRTMPQDVQTAAFQQAHSDGFNNMSATSGLGVKASDLKNISIDRSGNVHGTAPVAERGMDFTISPSQPMDTSNLVGSYKDANGNTQYVSATPSEEMPIGSDIEYGTNIAATELNPDMSPVSDIPAPAETSSSIPEAGTVPNTEYDAPIMSSMPDSDTAPVSGESNIAGIGDNVHGEYSVPETEVPGLSGNDPIDATPAAGQDASFISPMPDGDTAPVSGESNVAGIVDNVHGEYFVSETEAPDLSGSDPMDATPAAGQDAPLISPMPDSDTVPVSGESNVAGIGDNVHGEYSVPGSEAPGLSENDPIDAAPAAGQDASLISPMPAGDAGPVSGENNTTGTGNNVHGEYSVPGSKTTGLPNSTPVATGSIDKVPSSTDKSVKAGSSQPIDSVQSQGNGIQSTAPGRQPDTRTADGNVIPLKSSSPVSTNATAVAQHNSSDAGVPVSESQVAPNVSDSNSALPTRSDTSDQMVDSSKDYNDIPLTMQETSEAASVSTIEPMLENNSNIVDASNDLPSRATMGEPYYEDIPNSIHEDMMSMDIGAEDRYSNSPVSDGPVDIADQGTIPTVQTVEISENVPPVSDETVATITDSKLPFSEASFEDGQVYDLMNDEVSQFFAEEQATAGIGNDMETGGAYMSQRIHDRTAPTNTVFEERNDHMIGHSSQQATTSSKETDTQNAPVNTPPRTFVPLHKEASEVASGVTLDKRWKSANSIHLTGSRFTPTTSGGMELRSYNNEVMMYQDARGGQHYSFGTKTPNDGDFNAGGTYESAGLKNVKITGREQDGSFTFEADGYDRMGNAARLKFLARDYAVYHDEKGRLIKGNRTHKSLLITEVSNRKKLFGKGEDK